MAKDKARVNYKDGDSFEDMLKSMEEGASVYFSLKEFPTLSDEQILKLNAETKTRYFATKENVREMGNDDEEEDPIISKLTVRQGDYAKSASAKINGYVLTPGLRGYMARPDMLDEIAGRGWRVATSKDVISCSLKKVGKHYEVSENGKVELILMCTSEENYQRIRKQKDDANAAIGKSMTVKEER